MEQQVPRRLRVQRLQRVQQLLRQHQLALVQQLQRLLVQRRLRVHHQPILLNLVILYLRLQKLIVQLLASLPH